MSSTIFLTNSTDVVELRNGNRYTEEELTCKLALYDKFCQYFEEKEAEL